MCGNHLTSKVVDGSSNSFNWKFGGIPKGIVMVM